MEFLGTTQWMGQEKKNSNTKCLSWFVNDPLSVCLMIWMKTMAILENAVFLNVPSGLCSSLNWWAWT